MLQDGSEEDQHRFETSATYITTLAGLESLNWVKPDDTVEESATSLVGDMKVLVPLGSVIDKDAEAQRLTRERQKVLDNLNRARTKLDNPSFLERAPEQIVAQERQRVIEFEAALKDLDAQLARLSTN